MTREPEYEYCLTFTLAEKPLTAKEQQQNRDLIGTEYVHSRTNQKYRKSSRIPVLVVARLINDLIQYKDRQFELGRKLWLAEEDHGRDSPEYKAVLAEWVAHMRAPAGSA